LFTKLKEGIMVKLLLNLYLWLMFMIVTVLALALFPLFLIIYSCLLRRPLDSAIRVGIVVYGWVLVRMVPFFAPVCIESRTEKMTQPAIVVANHNSAVDPYLFGAFLIDACFITTWPFKIPVYGSFMRLAKYINADNGWEEVSRKCTESLRKGTSVIIWPEGHRSRDGRLGRFKNGAFAIAVETGFPLQPVCIIGSRKLLPPGKSIVSPSRIRLVLLDPVYPEKGNGKEEEIIRLRNEVKQVIERTLQEYEAHDFHEESRMKWNERGLKC
ncbi:MAG TPA: lysophospholipid acyltransferase family protein, partial [Bacillota bacterium]|nr:lysophospholipid acyltransferase family protein [Bacillota bacterium]